MLDDWTRIDIIRQEDPGLALAGRSRREEATANGVQTSANPHPAGVLTVNIPAGTPSANPDLYVRSDGWAGIDHPNYRNTYTPRHGADGETLLAVQGQRRQITIPVSARISDPGSAYARRIDPAGDIFAGYPLTVKFVKPGSVRSLLFCQYIGGLEAKRRSPAGYADYNLRIESVWPYAVTHEHTRITNNVSVSFNPAGIQQCIWFVDIVGATSFRVEFTDLETNVESFANWNLRAAGAPATKFGTATPHRVIWSPSTPFHMCQGFNRDATVSADLTTGRLTYETETMPPYMTATQRYNIGIVHNGSAGTVSYLQNHTAC